MPPLVDRTLAETIARASVSFPALLLTGPRQFDKTTLLEACAEPGRRGPVAGRKTGRNGPPNCSIAHETLLSVRWRPRLSRFVPGGE